MSVTIQQILSDAKRLASKLKEDDTAADALLAQAQFVYKKIDAMKQASRPRTSCAALVPSTDARFDYHRNGRCSPVFAALRPARSVAYVRQESVQNFLMQSNTFLNVLISSKFFFKFFKVYRLKSNLFLNVLYNNKS